MFVAFLSIFLCLYESLFLFVSVFVFVSVIVWDGEWCCEFTAFQGNMFMDRPPLWWHSLSMEIFRECRKMHRIPLKCKRLPPPSWSYMHWMRRRIWWVKMSEAVCNSSLIWDWWCDCVFKAALFFFYIHPSIHSCMAVINLRWVV